MARDILADDYEEKMEKKFWPCFCMILITVFFLCSCLSIIEFIAPDTAITGTVIDLVVTGIGEESINDEGEDYSLILHIPENWQIISAQGTVADYLFNLVENLEYELLYTTEPGYRVWVGTHVSTGQTGNISVTIKVLVGDFEGDTKTYNLKAAAGLFRDGNFIADDPEGEFDFLNINDEKYVESILVYKENSSASDIIVLTETSPDATIEAGRSVQVFGTGGANHITLENGADAHLINFPGNNTVTIHSDSTLFNVYRSGSAVFFEGDGGTFLKIPATTRPQSIVFDDESRTLIIDSGAVFMGDQVIDLTPASIENADGTGYRVIESASEEITANDGGSVTTASGASLYIPAGALPSDTTLFIEVLEIEDESDLIGTCLRISPDDIVLEEPITITMPIPDELTEDDELDVYEFMGDDPGNYIQTGVYATVYPSYLKTTRGSDTGSVAILSTKNLAGKIFSKNCHAGTFTQIYENYLTRECTKEAFFDNINDKYDDVNASEDMLIDASSKEMRAAMGTYFTEIGSVYSGDNVPENIKTTVADNIHEGRIVVIAFGKKSGDQFSHTATILEDNWGQLLIRNTCNVGDEIRKKLGGGEIVVHYPFNDIDEFRKLPSGVAVELDICGKPGCLSDASQNDFGIDKMTALENRAVGAWGSIVIFVESADPAYTAYNPCETVTNFFGMTFVSIAPGTFMMGSPEGEGGSDEPQHEVTLTQEYYIQTTEVTQGQWEAVMDSNPSYFSNCGEDCPVESVSKYDANNFIDILNSMGEGTYSLPSEAEWEYAARAGSTTHFANGDMAEYDSVQNPDPNLDAMGWYYYNSDADYSGCVSTDSIYSSSHCRGTHPVALKDTNAWGLYDMHGNVYEWCADGYSTTYGVGPVPDSVTDPIGNPSSSGHVAKGGCWVTSNESCRSANRYRPDSWDTHNRNIGFRLKWVP